jgi:hypothetical protein
MIEVDEPYFLPSSRKAPTNWCSQATSNTNYAHKKLHQRTNIATKLHLTTNIATKLHLTTNIATKLHLTTINCNMLHTTAGRWQKVPRAVPVLQAPPQTSFATGGKAEENRQSKRQPHRSHTCTACAANRRWWQRGQPHRYRGP